MNEMQTMSHERDGASCWCAETHNGYEGWTIQKGGEA